MGFKILVLMMVVVLTTNQTSIGQINITTTGSYTQNFDALINSGSGTWTSNSTIAGWYSQRTGTGNTITASTGSGNAGILASFGATANNERAPEA